MKTGLSLSTLSYLAAFCDQKLLPSKSLYTFWVKVQAHIQYSIPLYSVNGLYPAVSSSSTVRHSSVNMTHAALKAVHPPPGLALCPGLTVNKVLTLPL